MGPSDDEANMFLRNFADEAFFMLGKLAFRALVDESGVVKAMSTMRPYKVRNCYILLCMLKDRMQLKGDGLNTIIMPMSLAQAGAMGVDNIHQEIMERGAACYVDKCPFQDQTSVFCAAFCHIVTDSIVDALNEEFECIWTHHLTNGDPYCRYIFRMKSSVYINDHDLGKTLITVPRINMSDEIIREIRDFVGSYWLDAVVEAFNDLHGPDKTLEILIPIATEIGSHGGKVLLHAYPDMREGCDHYRSVDRLTG